MFKTPSSKNLNKKSRINRLLMAFDFVNFKSFIATNCILRVSISVKTICACPYVISNTIVLYYKSQTYVLIPITKPLY